MEDEDDMLEGLAERARIIRSAAPKSGPPTPLEETAEYIEWAVEEIRRLRATESPPSSRHSQIQ